MRVLIPLDGSSAAEQAIYMVRLLSPVEGIEARLIFVLDPFEGLDWGLSYEQWTESKERRRDKAVAYLQEQASKLAAAGVPATVSVSEGHPAHEIQAAAAAVDLIVMSTHGLSGIKRWARGSVADKVIRSGVADTLVVGPHTQEERRNKIATIMVPLDGSGLAEQALPIATRLAAALGARLHLVESVPFPVTAEGNLGYMFSAELYQGILDGVKAYLEKVRTTITGLHVETAMLEGQPATLLGNYVKEQAVDLVVMTSHGRGGLVRSALGSVTDRLIGEHAPVLVVQAKEEKE